MNYIITDFGASAENGFDNATSIQAAIDRAAENGGGTVVVPPGRFLSTTISLKSYVTLELQNGARLTAWPKIEDYPVRKCASNSHKHRDHDGRSFLVASDVESIGITGPGVIDGQGECFWEPSEGARKWIKARHPRVSPLLDLRNASHVRLTDVKLYNSPGWTVHAFCCDHVWVRGIEIDNYLFGPNTDGIDVNGCRDVTISDCQISCGDDCIVLKTTGDARSCERVAVTNCVLRTNCVPLKLGTESFHDFRQITFSNCVCYQSTRMVGLYAFDGGTMEQVEISNIVGDTDAGFVLNRPLEVMVNKRTPESKASTVRDVRVSGFSTNTDGRVLLTCVDGCKVERVKIDGLKMIYKRVDEPDSEESRSSKSLHYPKRADDARIARAAIVAQGLKDLKITNLSIVWPESPEVPMMALWGKSLSGGRIDLTECRAATAEAKLYALEDSTLTIVE